MEIRLLKSGYKNNEQFYKDFLEDKIKYNDEYFSDEIIELKSAPDFPIYMGVGYEKNREELFLKAFDVISKNYINLDRDIYLNETFWHSLMCCEKSKYIIEKYPNVTESINNFNNIVLKKFDWENYIYKCILGAQYVEDNIKEDSEKNKFYKLIVENLDLYNYMIKYEIFRNDKFIMNILEIIDELDLSKVMKAKIIGRDDLGKDERVGRRIIYEFNKSYPVIMAPMLEKEELKEIFLRFLSYYYDTNKLYIKQ
ncbi:DUF6339 family protein [Inconstantimicrobium porci]|uniref:Uncharacterized protein n=1 Tax=Inconstantimicrobium porci TaxID=2652291 RepID=A0A7X2MZS9_9CLOT|nr:DUF6339 family protein [Inconstantimicrobium porci]MSR92095.1 hypothetical protein [Inconstantimicrobium porci]